MKQIYHAENKKGGVSLFCSNDFDSVGRPIGKLNLEEFELDHAQLDSRGPEYLKECVEKFKLITKCNETSELLDEFMNS